jgi:hypothetical protein
MQKNINIVSKDTGDGLITILPWAYSAIIQGTWTFSINSAYYYLGIFYNSTNAVNDQIDYKVWLTKGQWQMSLGIGLNLSGSACIQVLLDSVAQGQIDPYSCSGAYYMGINGLINVTSTGLKTLSLLAKQGIGGNAYVGFNSIVLERAV